MSTTHQRRQLGIWGERRALEHLKAQNYAILDTNYRCPEGEIDIVAQQENCLVFVEVRTRRSRQFGTPQESITPKKVQRLERLGQEYIQSHPGLPEQWRIDVMAVELDRTGRFCRLEHVENVTG